MSSYTGYIMASPEPRDFGIEAFEQQESEVAKGPTLAHINGRVFGINRWEEFQLYSSVPLGDEPEGMAEGYGYRLFIVRGFAKVILLAQRRRVVDYAIGQIFDRRIFPNLRRVSVFVDRMIEHCQNPISEFLITSLHGRFSGPSTHLRSISLYGDDVTQSPIYVEHQRLFNFHSGGFGRRLFEPTFPI